jgi:asparagine synthase (glutamine-hydrolysing)
MCGIAGFTTLKSRVESPESLVRRMADTLRPRGPDGDGYFVDAHVALGHRRLSIIDVAGGAQPVATADGRYQFIYNGELYNYVELRAELEARGVKFSTHSDTEVLLYALAEFGVDGLQRCAGMFAFAMWDRQEKTLLLARDRVGIKPLYYALADGELIFASELKAMLVHPAIRRKLDLLSLSKFLTFGYVPAPNSIFENVRKLEAGQWLKFSAAGVVKETYWDIPLADNPLSIENVDEQAAELRDLLGDAVKTHLRSDVPVGVFLSGGIDSSAVVAMAAKQASTKLHTFSIGFEEASYDESRYARKVAELYSTEHHHEVLSSKRAVEMLPGVMKMLDEPFADASILPTYLLSQFTAQHVKVVLGGDGGDELFAGYPSFQAHKVTEKLSFLPTSWRDALIRWAKKLPVSHQYASVEFLLQQFFKGAGVSPEIRFFLWMGPFSNEQKRGVLAPDVQQALLRENPYEDVLNLVKQSGLVRDFERILYLCTKLYLGEGVLQKVDRASMANSLEVRVPLLDHAMVEFAARVPSVYKLHGLTTKFLLKRAMTGLLPDEIIHRRKAGFMIPLATWLKKDLRDMVEDLCSKERLERGGLFSPDGVRRLLDEHFNDVRDHRKLIWTLVTFQAWSRNYLE